ncbi:hypothetical protein CY91_04940 [Dehalococcoides mccartyi]|nr:hypothetical protein CY91_04940 [Dehalococcoides mccartyi]
MRSPIWPCSGRGLPGQPVTRTAGELLPHHFALTCFHRRYVSVALSVGSPPLGVTQHPVWRSSDFPPALKAGGHPVYLASFSIAEICSTRIKSTLKTKSG